MKRMKIPLANIRAKIRDTENGVYKKEDIDLFATEEEIKDANFMMIWLIYHIFTPYFILKSKSFYAFASA